MKIKLAILEKDQSYLNRIVSAFNAKYSDSLEIYSFTDERIAIETVNSARIDVLIISDAFDVDLDLIPKRCGVAYFVDASDVEELNNQRTIGRFQKAEIIYKQILSLYSENSGCVAGLKLGDEHTKVVAFDSPCGGVGTSTLAVAYAVRLAKQGKKVLYLNLEKYGSADVFFSGEGQFDMSDIIFALKSKTTNLAIKFESSVKQDRTGVFFFSQSKIALDMFELGKEEIIHLISELKIAGVYDCIIVDMDLILAPETLDVFRVMNNIIWVGDGTELSNAKLYRAYKSIAILEQDKETSLLRKIILIYNKFSNKIGKTVEGIEVLNIGGAPRYEHATTEQIIAQLSGMTMLDKIV